MIDRYRIRRCRALTLVETMALLFAGLMLLALCLPLLAAVGGLSNAEVSLSNLRIQGAAHATYAADWNGRQLTYTDDFLGSYGNDLSATMAGYAAAHGGASHPPLILGTTPPDFVWTWSGGGSMVVPMSFNGGFGAFRIPNAGQFNVYVGGRFYDDVFFAPGDTAPFELVEPAFSDPFGYFIFGSPSIVYPPSYCLSPAAMFHPDVMRGPSGGGWRSPFGLDHGFQSLPLSMALFPDLKTHVIEHHWVQNAFPDPCNPNFVGGRYDGCTPYYFNQSLLSEPASLFYDGSTRLLPVTEAINANDMTLKLGGDGLWSIDTPMAGGYTPFSNGGYFSTFGYDAASTGFHILTTEGILGRDTISMPAALKSRRLNRFLETSR